MLPVARRLRDYLPEILRPALDSICEAEEPELTGAWLAVLQGKDETFAATANEWGIARFERFLGLTPTLADTLEDRRFTVLAALMATKVITERSMAGMLDTMIGADRYFYVLDFRQYHLIVTLKLSARRLIAQVEKMLKERLPANLEIEIKIAWNTHDILAGFNHADLSLYTQDQLRTEQFTHTEYTRHEDMVYSTQAELAKLTQAEIQIHPF